MGESCFVYNLSDRLSLEDNIKILKIYRNIVSDETFCSKFGIYDIVPSYNSVAFHFESNKPFLVKEKIIEKINRVDYTSEIVIKTHYIDVVYNGIDLQKATEKLNLSTEEIVKRHSESEYHIAMLGFNPYFPFLLGLDKSLSMPRLTRPRNRIQAGSIGIGGSQTGIFPKETPSGWNIIGNSEFKDFSKFSPGDKIIFREV